MLQMKPSRCGTLKDCLGCKHTKLTDSKSVQNPPKSGYSKEGAQLEQILGARKDPESGALEFMVKW